MVQFNKQRNNNSSLWVLIYVWYNNARTRVSARSTHIAHRSSVSLNSCTARRSVVSETANGSVQISQYIAIASAALEWKINTQFIVFKKIYHTHTRKRSACDYLHDVAPNLCEQHFWGLFAECQLLVSGLHACWNYLCSHRHTARRVYLCTCEFVITRPRARLLKVCVCVCCCSVCVCLCLR